MEIACAWNIAEMQQVVARIVQCGNIPVYRRYQRKVPRASERIMGRAELGYVLLLLLFAATWAVVYFTRRFFRYRRDLARGKRDAKPVWKPFWL